MKRAYLYLNLLPDDYRDRALELFDLDYWIDHRPEDISEIGHVLGAAFDWAKTEEGYEYWSGVCNEYGWISADFEFGKE